MSSSTSSPNQVIQVISFTILNDSTFEKSYTRDGRRWAKAMQIMEKQNGWLQTLWGRDMNCFHKIDLFIVWTCVEIAEDFKTSPTFEATFSTIAISPLSIHYFSIQAPLPSHLGPTEIITFFFPSSLSITDEDLFEKQVQHCTKALLTSGLPPSHTDTLNTVHGWTVGDIANGEGAARGCVVMLMWKNLDQMFDTKNDKESLFNNSFVALRGEASEGVETKLYTRLKDVRKGKRSCAVM